MEKLHQHNRIESSTTFFRIFWSCKRKIGLRVFRSLGEVFFRITILESKIK